MKQIRKRLTYANVMSSIAVFLVIGGATAFAAHQLGKNSVGKKQLKNNAVTTAKIKKNAVSAPKIKANAVTDTKIKANAVTTSKILNGAVTGEKVNVATLPTVPNSATTNVVKTSKGTLTGGQEATPLEYGPLKVSIKCFTIPSGGSEGNLAVQAFIASSTDGSVFSSWEDGSNKLGPSTPAMERELNGETWVDSSGPFTYEPPAEVTFSASAANGQGFNGFLGLATEKDTNTCWYWLNATTLG